jgi:uncharacterized protein YbaP (TraB family)
MLGSAGRVVLPALMVVLALTATSASAERACPPRAGIPTEAQIREGMATARDRGALWRFAKDGRHGYLYGTIHVGKPEWAMPGRLVFDALTDAETIVMEADPLDPVFHAGIVAPARAGEAPRLPAALTRRLRAQAVKVCTPWDGLSTMPPMLIATVLTLRDAAWEGLFAEYASEMVLAGYAKGAGKSIDVLETTAIQRAALTGGHAAEQLAAVEDALGGLERGATRREVVAIAEAWAGGDLETLRRTLLGVSPADQDGLERLVTARNPGMAARVEALHADGRRPFVAAGILHMIGETGLPALLRARGFTVERVEFDGRVGLDIMKE